MAAVTLRSGVASTSNNAAVVSASFTPTAAELLLVAAMHSGNVLSPAITVSANGSTFTKVMGPILKNASADAFSVFVADQLIGGSPSAMTVTSTPSGGATGGIIFVWSVTSITRTGLIAVRQSGSQTNAAASTPAVALGAAALTGNPLIGAVFNITNPATMTPPTSWTETVTIGDIGFATPTNGGEAVFINSGFTGSTVTWGSASGSALGSFALELDTTVPPTSVNPNQRSRRILANLVR